MKAIFTLVILCMLAAAQASQFSRGTLKRNEVEAVKDAGACIQDITNAVNGAVAIVMASLKVPVDITGIMNGVTTIVQNIFAAIADC